MRKTLRLSWKAPDFSQVDTPVPPAHQQLSHHKHSLESMAISLTGQNLGLGVLSTSTMYSDMPTGFKGV